uniref:DUF2141 domain-containing protein n=1 Tax=Parerythrobacter lutipelagi TaxID=1964208 RepID=UPI0010F5DE35|nr:DUF2141 domain-containing protein [Parerythrobacter lutipelagi]
MSIKQTLKFGTMALAAAGLVLAGPAAAQYRQKIAHDPGKCRSGSSVKVNITGIETSSGNIRVQSYRGTKADWLEKGRWINRIELPASKGSMTVCMPLPGPGVYGIAVRHDTNGNGKTDLSQDGGGMSNNPSINIFNLGKPSYKKTQFSVGDSPSSITIRMRYM